MKQLLHTACLVIIMLQSWNWKGSCLESPVHVQIRAPEVSTPGHGKEGQKEQRETEREVEA